MSLWRQLSRGLSALIHPSAADRDVADEVEHYLELAAEENAARGMPRGEAIRAARLAAGGETGVREAVHEAGWENRVESLLADLRYAARRLRSAPGFAAVSILTLSVGIGATTAIFSVVDPILLEPLPYPNPGRLASIVEAHRDGSTSDGTFALFRLFEERARSIEAIAAYRPWKTTVTGVEQPELLVGQRVTREYFRLLGVSPAVGRDFQPSDDRVKGPNVVILSDALWRRQFGADRTIVGRTIKLDDGDFSVIGVMPRRFENVLAPSAELWAPLQYDPSLPADGREWGHHLRTVGRLRRGVAVERAAREVDRLGREFVRERRPVTYDPETRFSANALHEEITRGVKPALLALLGAAALVLVIACVNVTNLLLARGAERRGEFALRAALGAGRGRLIRQSLTENLLLASIGGAAGVAVAVAGVRALSALSPPELPRAGAIAVNATVFAFGLGLTTLVGLAFGMIPALEAAGSDPRLHLEAASRRISGIPRRARGALVVAEVAIALVLLVGSGLLFRSLDRLFAVPAGFDSSRLLTMQVQETGRRFDSDGARHRFFEEALEAVRRVPGVESAAWTSQLPLSGDKDGYGATFEATSSLPAGTYGSYRYAVSPGYLETMRIPLRNGRRLDRQDRPGAPLSALISESLASVRFPGESPIGKRLRVGDPNGAPPYTIVGVVGNVKQMSLALDEPDAIYVSSTQWPWADTVMSLVVRSRGDAAALAPAVRRAIWSVDKDQPIVRVATMDALVAASAAERRFALLLFEAFALAALLLAAAGIYGVLAGSVAERTREIGVRSALGASRANILSLVLGEGMKLTGLGLAAGLAGAAAASRAIAALMFGVSLLDPVTYLGVLALLSAVSALACGVPAWRAARVDPATTLRAE